MRKILISVVLGLLIVGSVFFIVNGINGINIKGIKEIDKKNTEIEKKISELSNVISVRYKNTESSLKSTAGSLQTSKTEYENQAILSSSNKESYASKQEAYEIDYLWTKLGNYAKSEGVVIKIELVSSGASENLYNLNFTVTGAYVNITDFIYDIENDSKLGFKIDEFAMEPKAETEGENSLTAKFSCKEIPIKVGEIEQAEGKKTTTENYGTNSTSVNSSTNTSTNTNTNSTGNVSTNTTNTMNSYAN